MEILSPVCTMYLLVSILHSVSVFNFLLVSYKANEQNILSVTTERQKEIETLQKIITSLTLQLRERNKQIEELKQSLKGNWYTSKYQVETMLSVCP